jgi:hypothetical protein
MIVPAVILIALSVLFFLTSLALHATWRLPHPFLTLLALAVALVLGLASALD